MSKAKWTIVRNFVEAVKTLREERFPLEVDSLKIPEDELFDEAGK